MKAYKQAAHANMVNNQAEVQVHANDAMVAEDVTMGAQFEFFSSSQKNTRLPVSAQYWWISNRQTTYNLDANIGKEEKVFRAHPISRNEWPWYDYALVKW